MKEFKQKPKSPKDLLVFILLMLVLAFVAVGGASYFSMIGNHPIGYLIKGLIILALGFIGYFAFLMVSGFLNKDVIRQDGNRLTVLEKSGNEIIFDTSLDIYTIHSEKHVRETSFFLKNSQGKKYCIVESNYEEGKELIEGLLKSIDTTYDEFEARIQNKKSNQSE
jgi:hypothetical protein